MTEPQKFNACSVRAALGVLAVVAVLGIAVALGFMLHPAPDKGSAGSALSVCQDEMTARLVAPATAKFSPYGETTVWKTNQPGDNWGVRGYVDAQNRMGAMLRTHYLCVARYDGDGDWTITEFEIATR